MRSSRNSAVGQQHQDPCELGISDMKAMLADGRSTSTELVVAYLNRLFFYDVNGIRLNSTPIIAADAIKEAMIKDTQRAQGKAHGTLHGIPYTVKDSYMAKGMTMAAGSPAFSHVVANEDSFSVASLRQEGAILLGRTNMPPMAAGGVQRGVYGRSENPYNGEYLAAAWYSGSSHGSAVSTAASFAAFGMGEETVSSGRSPAANNGVVAYTPSRGVISLRGNWVLHATKDEVVPHTRTVPDLLELLPALTREDDDTRGDMWRGQSYVPLEGARQFREEGFAGITDMDALAGLRIGVVNEYAGRIGGVIPAVYTRPSISALLLRAVDDLEALGADVRWTPLPLRDAYETAPRDLKTFADEGLIPHDWMEHEWLQLNAAALQEFITSFDISGLDSLLDVNPDDIFPNPFNSVAHRVHWQYGFYQQAAEYIRSGRLLPLDSTPGLAEGLRGLERIRKRHLEDWMRSQQLDVLIFPTNSNIGRADADVDTVHNTEAWQDGTWFSNGNRMIRHLGIPTVSVSMGLMDDTGVPAGLTFMGPSGSDRLLLACAYAYEQSGLRRAAPQRTPPIERLARIEMDHDGAAGAVAPGTAMQAELEVEVRDGVIAYGVHAAQPDKRYACRIFVNGLLINEWSRDDPWAGELSLAAVFDARCIAVVALYSGSGGTIGADVKVRDMPRLDVTASSLI
ncbi:amidase [Bifidobacterium crudilactis]|jgi:amidase|uniref:amidase n=1 Tax=Bifidobacterium crudilactis TaxID=327277 RepID=UPI002356B2BE|nr:amidase [Bifidobacterium crudilactis]MCI1217386.1 amidase [Bifidobacterium crudilactis]